MQIKIALSGNRLEIFLFYYFLMPDTRKYTFDNTEFMAMLAHDLKTPVKAQIRALNLLYSGVLGEFSENQRNLILNILISNKYMQALLDNVLGEYRLNKPDFVLDKKTNDIRKTIEETICSVGILSEAKEQKICVKYLTEDFIKIYDEVEIKRVILNLLVNAFEYSASNSTINILIKKENKKIKISIESNVENAPVIKAGLGLGLEICKKIINSHNGEFSSYTTKDGKYLSVFALP